MKTLQHKRGTAAILTANNPVLAAGEYGIETDTGRVKIGDGSTAWAILGYAFSTATNLTAGTLPDARLSANIPTWSTVVAFLNQPSAAVDIFPRGEAGIQTVAPASGTVWITFFTPATTITVSSITIASGTGTAASGLTLARMGLYTFDETTATLVARTASDTTLFGSTVTSYQRSFSTVGSFPSSYQCVGGTRYGAAVVCVGTTPPTLACRAVNIGIAAMSPRMSAQIAGQSDLPTSSTITSSMLNEPFARLS
jgi:hypothetical protein